MFKNFDKSKIESVRDYWQEAACGEELYLKDTSEKSFQEQLNTRYRLEPFIIDFAEFNESIDHKVLEIGVGVGADHFMFASSKCNLWGIDLTEKAIELCKKRLNHNNLNSNLSVGNAESLKFENDFFDKVYSWGVIHHSPDTEQCISEIYRVLKPGGTARIMIYNYYSIVGFMLWLRFGLFNLRPFTKLKDLYSERLESPGTKAYTPKEAKKMFSYFQKVEVDTVLTHADLLNSDVGQRYKNNRSLKIAKLIWPSLLIKIFFPKNGLFLMIKVKK